MMFALTGLNDMENVPEGKARLLKMQGSIHHDSLLKSYGLPTWAQLTKDDGDDEDDAELDSASQGVDKDPETSSGSDYYNPDEPRIPAGQPGGGQWTTAGNGTSTDSGSISADDIRTALGVSLAAMTDSPDKLSAEKLRKEIERRVSAEWTNEAKANVISESLMMFALTPESPR